MTWLLYRLPLQPRMRGFSLLGRRPPVNEPQMQRMHGPLLEAPFELLPAPSSVGRMERPLPPSPPPRSMLHMQSAGEFPREPPQRFVCYTDFVTCNDIFCITL